MKVLICNFHPQGGGGHVTYIELLTKLQQEPELQIHVATPFGSDLYLILKEKGYKYLYAQDFPQKIQKEPIKVFKAIRRFRSLVLQVSPDLVHCNGGADLFIATWAFLFRPKFRLIRTHHAVKNIGSDFYHKFIYSKVVSKNIYVSKSAFDLSTMKGFTPSNCEVIENCVDLRLFCPRRPDEKLQMEFNPSGKLVFGSCAGTAPYKRVDLLIKAVSRLPHVIRQRVLVLVLGEERHVKDLSKLASDLDVDFKWLGHVKVRDELPRYISIFDFGFVLSDAIETISFAVREMMACGKPVLSSNYAGLIDNFEDKNGGFFVNAGDLNDTSDKLFSICSNLDGIVEDQSKLARQRAITFFNLDSQLEKHKRLYMSLFIA